MVKKCCTQSETKRNLITSHVSKKVSGRESLNQANCPLDTFNLLPPGLLLNKLSLTCLSSDIGEEIWSFTIERTKNCVLPPADARSSVKCEKNKRTPLLSCVDFFVVVVFFFVQLTCFIVFIVCFICFLFFIFFAYYFV